MWHVVKSLKKTNGHNKSRLPWGRGMVFKGWWDEHDGCLHWRWFHVFLKAIWLQLVPKSVSHFPACNPDCLIQHSQPHWNELIFHFFAFPCLQTEVDQKSEPAQVEVAGLVHPVQGWWNGKEGTELSYPLLVQNVIETALELPAETPEAELLVCFLCYGGWTP